MTKKHKELKRQLKKMEWDLDLLKNESIEKNREFSLKDNEVKEVKRDINLIERVENSKNIGVTDHAVVRFFERVLGFDISEIESAILTSEVLMHVKNLGGDGHFPNENFKVVMKGYKVLTVI